MSITARDLSQALGTGIEIYMSSRGRVRVFLRDSPSYPPEIEVEGDTEEEALSKLHRVAWSSRAAEKLARAAEDMVYIIKQGEGRGPDVPQRRRMIEEAQRQLDIIKAFFLPTDTGGKE